LQKIGCETLPLQPTNRQIPSQRKKRGLLKIHKGILVDLYSPADFIAITGLTSSENFRRKNALQSDGFVTVRDAFHPQRLRIQLFAGQSSDRNGDVLLYEPVIDDWEGKKTKTTKPIPREKFYYETKSTAVITGAFAMTSPMLRTQSN
jgi:hypothetical protein